jgi:multidrug efflux pump subunit AcrA (membrane-fusion protein)
MHTEIDFQNPDGKLLPGMYAIATVPEMQKLNALTLPVEAVELKDNNEGTVLLVNAQDVLEERKVQLGIQGNTRIEITSGLKEGDRVVVGGRSEFRDGMKVTPKELDGGRQNAGSK